MAIASPICSLSYMYGAHVIPNSRITAVMCSTVNVEFHWTITLWYQKSLLYFCNSVAIQAVLHKSEAEQA